MQSTARKNVGERDEAIVLTWQRKVQVYKRDDAASLHEGEVGAGEGRVLALAAALLPDAATTSRLAHLSSQDSYFEDLEPGTKIEHSRGRTMTSEHIHLTAVLDNTSQVHCNQFMIDLDPKQYVGGQLIIFGGIPFVLCLGLSSPDVGDNALGDLVYKTGRHTAPLFAGDTVFAATEVLGKRELPGRPDLGIVETRLLGHKFERDAGREPRRRAAGLEEDADLRARARDRRQAPQPLRRLAARRARAARAQPAFASSGSADPAPVALGRLRAGDRDVAAREAHGGNAADAELHGFLVLRDHAPQQLRLVGARERGLGQTRLAPERGQRVPTRDVAVRRRSRRAAAPRGCSRRPRAELGGSLRDQLRGHAVRRRALLRSTTPGSARQALPRPRAASSACSGGTSRGRGRARAADAAGSSSNAARARPRTRARERSRVAATLHQGQR